MKTRKLATSSKAITAVCLGSSPYHLVSCRHLWDYYQLSTVTSAHHLRIEVPGVLVDQPELAGVGDDQGEAEEDQENVHGQQSLLTPRFCQQAQGDGSQEDVENSFKYLDFKNVIFCIRSAHQL